MSAHARPRRRRKSAASRLRPFWILFLIVLVLVAACGFWLATWPGLYPKNIRVEGNHIVPSAQIISRAGIVRTKNLWLQKRGPIEARVEAIPYIESAVMHRRLPADASIEVTERKPFAVVASGEARVLVDHALRVLQDAQGDETLPLLKLKAGRALTPGTYLSDAAATTLRDSDDLLATSHITVAALELDKYGDLVAQLRGGVRVLLGDDANMEKKIALIDPILAQAGKGGRRIARVDLRAPSAPTVEYAK